MNRLNNIIGGHSLSGWQAGRLGSATMMNYFKGFRLFLNRRRAARVRSFPAGHYVNAVDIQKQDWILIVPIGEFPEHPWGPHTITADDIENMAKNFANTQMDLLFDYEHESLWGRSKAAGWSSEVEARSDGLYCRYPEFTPAAQEMIRNREYRYFSPVYTLDAFDKKNQSIGAKIVSVGLTNTPYMDNEIDHIGNSSTKEETMDLLQKLIQKFKLNSDATEADVLSRIDELSSAPGEGPDEEVQNNGVSPDEPAETVVNSKIEDRIKALESRIESADKTAMETRVATLVDTAVNDGKILPADRDIYMNAARIDFDATKARLDALPKNSSTPRTVETPAGPETKVNSHTRLVEYLRTQRTAQA